MATRTPLVDFSIGSNALLYTICSYIIVAICRLFYHHQNFYGQFRKPRIIQFHSLTITIDKEVTIQFCSKENQNVLVTKVGKKIPVYVSCDVVQNINTLLLDFKDHAKLRITCSPSNNPGQQEYDFDWTSNSDKILEDDIMMTEGGHWYGAGHVFRQTWPLEKWNYRPGAFISRGCSPFKTMYGEIQERMWISSSGIAIHVDSEVPLFVGTNHDYNKIIQLISSYKSPYQCPDGISNTFLSYKIYQTNEDAVGAFHSLRKGHRIPVPKGIPDKNMFKFPIWSTWAQYKKDISQDKVLEFAGDIQKYGFKACQLEIDDDWTPHYGDWDFDQKKFSDPKGMINKLKQMGYRVTIWVHPYTSLLSSTFLKGYSKHKDFWVKWKYINILAITKWWNGYAALLDVTNEDAVAWFRTKMDNIRETYGVTSFKVDAGEASYLSVWTKTKELLSTPNMYTKQIAKMTYDLDTEIRAQELRVGVGSQNLPIFFRLSDKDSNWDHNNGIKTVIPNVLTQGLIGYPFILPDMIGGNAYSWISGSSYPDKELFIRWVQLNALLPSMQFSIVPWMYDKETIKISKKMCDLHEQFSEEIISLAEESVQTGVPIIRPIWWIAPKDEAALTCSSEFLLGNDILVAPVLDKGARSRDIYLPPGIWRDAEYNNELQGGMWYKNYPAQLDQLPYFVKI